MLAVEHIIVTVAVADLRGIDQTGIKLRCNLADPLDVQLPLVSTPGNLQQLAVDHHFLVGTGVTCSHVVLLIFCRY